MSETSAQAYLRGALSDLSSLSAEARRGVPAVKEAAERALAEGRRLPGGALPSSSGDGGAASAAAAAAAAAASALLRPFLLACNPADAGKRLACLALSALQRAVSAGALPRADLPQLARVLEIQVRG